MLNLQDRSERARVWLRARSLGMRPAAHELII